MDILKLHDTIALIKPLPEFNLRRGEIGVIVDAGPRDQYLVEFSGRNGIPYATPTVSVNDIMKVYLHADIVE
ncbi:DUF4926 domain-containing protein [Spirosoma fluminis]